MSAMPKGTKQTDNPKNTTIQVRMDADTVEKLDESATALKTNRSEVVRQGVNEIHKKVKRNEKKEQK